MSHSEMDITRNRVAMAFVGALAGLAAWYFVELASEAVTNTRLLLFMMTGTLGFFGILLGLVGPLSWSRGVAGAGALALLAAALMVWASLRFDSVEGFFDMARPVVALFLLLFVGTPFVSAGLQKPGGASDYALLFDTAWGFLVRYLAGWLFVAVVWGIVFLSDALLELVGITVIEQFIEVEPVPYALTGLFLGLALAIMHELRDFVSPFLVLRLFRILLPVLTLVVAVFLVALPLRGFGSLFGNLSVAGTLMSVAIAALTLITSALDRTVEDEVRAPAMRVSARVMAGLLVPLCLAAAWAVWLRVTTFGWTPDRVAAGLSAVVLLVYAIGYGVAVIMPGWPERIRALNPPLALGVVAVAALWLTPLLNAEAISTRSQITRFEAGQVAVEDLALWEMKDKWGRPGQAGLAQLRERAQQPDAEALAGRLERLDAAESRWAFERDERNVTPSDDVLAGIHAALKVWPEGKSVTQATLAGLPGETLSELRVACAVEGLSCALVLDDLNPYQTGEEGVLLMRSPGEQSLWVVSVKRVDDMLELSGRIYNDVRGTGLHVQGEALLQALAAGDVRIEPSKRKMISIGGVSIIP